MAKKSATKQRNQELASALQVKALQNQFEIAGNEYPGLAHVLMLRPETKCDEQLDDKALIFDEKALKGEFEALDEKLQRKFGTFQDFASYKRTVRGRFPFESARLCPGSRAIMSDPASSSNLCQVWHYGSGLEYKVGMSWVHFLCHRRGECWNKGRATERFLTLVELTGGLLAEPTIVNHLGLSQEMQHLTYAVDRWLVALHECGLAKAYNSMLPENLDYMIMDLLLPITNFFCSERIAYLGAVPDVWVASSLLCARVLDLEVPDSVPKTPAQFPYQNQVPWSKTDLTYYENKQAIKDAQQIGHDHDVPELTNLDYGRLKRSLRKPGCQIKFMSRKSPPRGKVNKEDWQRYLQSRVKGETRIQKAIEQETLSRIS